MFAILAEDDSDAETLRNLVKRNYTKRVVIKIKGYEGCGALCKKGARDIKLFAARGAKRVIVCHDADKNPPEEIKRKLMTQVIEPSGFNGDSCVVVPVEEIEAWLIADEAAINQVIPTFRFRGHAKPEAIPNPKDWLCKQSRVSNGKPLYSPKTFNPAVANRLDFDVVAQKCPSFRLFLTWLRKLKSKS